MEKLLLLTVLVILFSLEVVADFHLPKPPYCGKTNLSSSNSRIYDGTITGLDEYPFVVHARTVITNKLGLGPWFEGNCTSSLITSNWVLTAAHCVTVDDLVKENPLLYAQKYYVTLGEWDTHNDPDCVKENVCAPKSVTLEADPFIHPKYYTEHQMRFDIALLRLERDVVFSPYVQRVCLPIEPVAEGLPSYEGRQVIITGWGRYDNKYEGSQFKRKATVTVRASDYEHCQRVYGEALSDNHLFCVGGPDGGVCRFDSGGPLLLQSSNDENTFYQIGVTSHGRTSCEKNTVPSAHVRVDAFIDWISETIKRNDRSG